MKLMLSCKQASQIISQSLDNPLSWSDRMKLKFHLLMCDACTNFNRQLRLIKSSIRRMRHETENDTSVQLTVDAKARINQAINSNHL
ncbi:MAG: zf-HC2 domain-containing protein [Methylotenera sp.]|uniref:zf-HC2 domain-containing protein n=1 Tax=Methylotenera sp. TaxID=2051956 RepID=UPI002487A38C|nr:zf-HC2 domain-containing protein [Methylotenera sp.]MDI1309766.1 zf-HC2 domain-containing protein [Methylotenera sp.]